MYIMILLASTILNLLLPFILRSVHLDLKDSMTNIIWAKPLDVRVTDAEQPSGIYQGRETYLSPDCQRPLLISGWIADTKMRHFLALILMKVTKASLQLRSFQKLQQKDRSVIISIPFAMEWLDG